MPNDQEPTKPRILPRLNNPDRAGGEEVTLKNIIGQAIGAASVCWENMTGTGVFDSSRARQILDEVMEAISETASEVDENTSDGYHTFKELYEYRLLYNAALFNEWAAAGKHDVHKSHHHHDGEPPFGGGWFIVVAELPTGQISNHYPDKDWPLFRVPVRTRANRWDGHTPADVAQRLRDHLTGAGRDIEPDEAPVAPHERDARAIRRETLQEVWADIAGDLPSPIFPIVYSRIKKLAGEAAPEPERDRKAELVVEISDSVARDAEQLADILHREGPEDDVAAAVASLAGYLADLAKDVKALAVIVAEGAS